MIVFKEIRYKNILSTGNFFTTIPLNKNNTTLIVGENGSGKSTMLDALAFVLYGKPFRKINKPQLMNSINKKNLLVELEFSVGKLNYKVRRGINPNIFEILENGKMLNQDASTRDYQEYLEKNILKMNFKSFGQIVILGSSTFVPFMQLPAGHRREIIEDLLDIQIFTKMNVLLKDKIADIKNSITETKHKQELISERIKAANHHNQSIINLKKKDVENIKDKADIIQKENDKLKVTIDNYTTNLNEMKESVKDLHDVNVALSELTKIESTVIHKLAKHNKNLEFYNNNDD